MGQVPPQGMTLVENIAQAETVTVPTPDKVAVLTQTTLSVDETKGIFAVLRRRFPALQEPKTDDICYATQNRQDAVKALAQQADAILVVGSKNSSNSNRLKEVAVSSGVTRAYLVDGPADLAPDMFDGVKTLGITAGASAPEHVVQAVVAAVGATRVDTLTTVTEDITFQLPKAVRP
jgi:4-hydroxy-3-methylbut-2-enyl diphosphate reductase